jgi:hypothetical protein
MDFSASGLIAGLIVSCVGLALFKYGKKELRWPQLVSGIGLMAAPCFAPSATWDVGIAVALLVLMWAALRAGI